MPLIIISPLGVYFMSAMSEGQVLRIVQKQIVKKQNSTTSKMYSLGYSPLDNIIQGIRND